LVTLIVNADCSEADILVNGEEAIITSNNLLIKKIEVPKTQGNTHIQFIKGSGQICCELKTKISDNNQRIPCQ